ncbi:DUF4249 family protein [Fulvitalea axinellae]|uniref:DUF4249 family protein n=1 Tax=Fulvitalea axinellae TaxID=1182444 RepID=UPI0030CA4BD6
MATDVEVDPEDLGITERKLTVLSVISPTDETIKVKVYKNLSLFGERREEEEAQEYADATVTISSGEITKEIPYLPSEKCYSLLASEFPIVEGKRYTLRVKSPLADATASCTVPKALEKVNLILTEDKEGRLTMLKASWEDNPDSEDFYALEARYRQFRTPQYGPENWYISHKRTIYPYDRERPFPIQDLNRVSSGMTETVAIYDRPYNHDKEWLELRVAVSRLDTHFGKYARWQNYAEIADLKNPFTEPSATYTNFDNAFGVFGAKSNSEWTYFNKFEKEYSERLNERD